MDVQISISYEELMQATAFLSREQQQEIISRLKEHIKAGKYLTHKTREQHIAEHEALKAAGRFPTKGLEDAIEPPDIIKRMTDDELEDYLREIGREWEKELDELS